MAVLPGSVYHAAIVETLLGVAAHAEETAEVCAFVVGRHVSEHDIAARVGPFFPARAVAGPEIECDHALLGPCRGPQREVLAGLELDEIPLLPGPEPSKVLGIGKILAAAKGWVGSKIGVVIQHPQFHRMNGALEVEASNVKLQAFDRLKSMFIASMSHELRTPLNSIIGFTGMTLQGLSGELNDEQKDNLSRSNQSAKHLLSLITDVIDISKIEAGRIDAFMEEISLKEVLTEAIGNVKPQMKEKILEIVVEAPANDRVLIDYKPGGHWYRQGITIVVLYTQN